MYMCVTSLLSATHALVLPPKLVRSLSVLLVLTLPTTSTGTVYASLAESLLYAPSFVSQCNPPKKSLLTWQTEEKDIH